jgi:formate dehydrogenase subunit gamma
MLSGESAQGGSKVATSPHTPLVEWSAAEAEGVIEAHAGLRGPLLPVLHALQERFGYVDARAVPLVANRLNLSRADVHGVITFYKDFRSELPGAVQVSLCRAEACQAVGAHELAEHAKASLGIDFGTTTSDRSASLDQVFCLGNCALGPSVTVDGRLYGRVDHARFDSLLARALGGRSDGSGG